MSRWFLGARSWEVRRENVKEFFGWALLYKGDDKAHKSAQRVVRDGPEGEEEAIEVDEEVSRKAEEEKELDEYVDGVQTLLGRSIAPGRGPAKCLRLTVDEVRMLHRPLVWYLVCCLALQLPIRANKRRSRSSRLIPSLLPTSYTKASPSTEHG